ncbi:MAG: hypothetical protein LCH61_20095 [Proteobacteria bacterium]|nr:hypothetical protein [Pseudomonadota bacterium]
MPGRKLIIAVALCAALGACQDSTLDLASAPQRRISVGPTVPVAVESLQGMPESVAPRFSAALASEAQARDIAIVDAAGAPRYKLRGYFNAYTAEGGNRLAWVFDVFDSRLQRARRAEGSEPLRGSATDPWSLVDDTAIRRAAARSLDEVGGYLADQASVPAPAATPRQVVASASAR